MYFNLATFHWILLRRDVGNTKQVKGVLLVAVSRVVVFERPKLLRVPVDGLAIFGVAPDRHTAPGSSCGGRGLDGVDHFVDHLVEFAFDVSADSFERRNDFFGEIVPHLNDERVRWCCNKIDLLNKWI